MKSEGVRVELASSFSDFSCKEKITVLGTESPYDLIPRHALVGKTLNMDRLENTQSCYLYAKHRKGWALVRV